MNDQRDRRLARIEDLRSAGADPYPPKFEVDADVTTVRGRFGDLAPDTVTDERVRMVGRVMLVRHHGGVGFITLQQGGDRIQVVLERDRIGRERLDRLRLIDRGDVVGIEGVVGTSRSGELSVFLESAQLLAASLRPSPDKHRGPTSSETRMREREVDLYANDESRRTFEVRSSATLALRDELHGRDFIEVETPVFSIEAGGAAAKPFVTHHNALGIDLHLRVAPELYLKRLVVGGFDRVFEVARVFRNEGIDTRHNPEFTMLEVYQAPADYLVMMQLVQDLVVAAAKASIGSTTVAVGGLDVDLAAPWRRATMVDLVEETTGVRIEASMEIDAARAALDSIGVSWEPAWGAGKCLQAAFDARVEKTLIAPTIVMDHPVETSPLARRHRDDPTLTERFEVIVGGVELANAYSELNDPVEQRRRFEREQRRRELGDVEANVVDEDFLRALESGMPPTGGLGIGIDRLVMLLAGKSSIRDVILFPTLRPARDALSPGDGARAPVVPTVALPTAVHPGAPVGFVRLSGLVRVVAGLTAVVGALTILTAVPRLGVRAFLVEELVSPLPVALENRVLAIAIGVILVLLSSQLLRAKRRAWALTLGVFVASVGVSVASGGELVALLTSGGMIVILLLTRREFTGLRDPPSVFAVARLVPRYLVVVYGYGIVALLGQRVALEPSFTLWRSIQAITAGLFGFEGPYTYRGRFASWFPTSLVVLGAVGLLLLLWLLLRPAVRVGSRDGRPRARELVDRYGWDSLAPFALRRDRSYFFSSDGKAMVAYGYLGGFALVTGDPIGEVASIPLVVDEFLEFCRLHGWQPAFLAAREVDVAFYAERGFRDFYLGDEAILDCRRFDLEGPGMAPVRQSVRRIQRGHRFELIPEASATAELMDQLNDISDQWRKGEDERGYTMAMSTDVGTDDPDRLLAIAWCTGEDGSRPETPVGFLRLVPTGDPDGPHGRGYTLDMMRRLPGGANGLTEFLVANTVEELDRQGVLRLSLNFASFARLLDDDVQHTRFDRFLRRIVEAINPYYQISSLLEFNEKFQPEWLPRVLIYADPADLPKVALRYAWLEGFFDVPLLGRLLSGPSDAVAADEILK